MPWRLSRRQGAGRGDAEAPASARARSPVTFVPVLCGSAFKNKGVQPLLDAVVDYLPSPLDMPRGQGHRPQDRQRSRAPGRRQGAVRAASPSRSWTIRSSAPSPSCRVYSGKLETGTGVLNSAKDKNERVGRMLLMHANNREDIKEAYAGDIVALAGLKDTTTGDTLCDPQQAGDPGEDGIPRSGHRGRDRAEDQGRSGKDGRGAGQARAGRSRRSASRPIRNPARPSSRAWANCISTSRSISCKRTYKVDANVGAPQVAYRETLTRPVDDRLHAQEADRRSGPVRRSQDRLRAAAAGLGLRVRERGRRRLGAEGIHSRRSKRASKAQKESGRAGRLPGDRLQGDADRRHLSRSRFHRRSPSTSRRARRSAKRCRRARSVLLEPIMKVEVVTPEDYPGCVIGDLNSPPRPGAGQGHARQRAGRHRHGAARQHVRLRQHAALDVPGPRDNTRCSSIITSKCRKAIADEVKAKYA